MTDSTFATDKGNQEGTNQNSSFNQADNAVEQNNSGNDLQNQIDVMQKRIGDKDEFIGTLKDENQTLREKMADIEAKIAAMGDIEEHISRMKEAQNQNSNQDTTLDEDDIVSRVKNKLDAERAAATADKNFNEVAAKLTKTFGADKVDETVRKAAAENGLSFDDMFELARKSPSAVYRMIGITSAPSANPSHNTNNGFNEQTKTKEEKLAYFSKLRKENPKEYYKPEVQKAFREACLSK